MQNQKKPIPKGAQNVPARQILTVFDLTGAQPVLELECPECRVIPDRIGAKFCSNCGIPLAWNNVEIRQPQAPTARPDDPAPTN